MKKEFFLFLLPFMACSKDKDEKKVSLEHLTNHKWKLISFSGKKADGTVVPDSYSSFPEYDKDDFYLFRQDLTFIWHANTLKKSGNTDDILDSGTYLIKGDSLKLKSTMTSQPGSTTTYFPTRLLELNSTIMKWESTDPQTGVVIWTSYSPIP